MIMPYYSANSKAVACYYRLETSLLSDAVTDIVQKEKTIILLLLPRERVSFRGGHIHEFFFCKTKYLPLIL